MLTDGGPIETEHVVNAAGIWAPQVAAMVGAFVPSVPVDHQHVAMQAVAGHEIPRDAPCFRDPDNLVYGKAEAGGLLIGGYEPDPPARWTDGVPWDHAASPVESDMDRFAPLLEGAIRRFPFLEDAGVIRLLCHPDAMTPDGNPLLGPMPGRARVLGRRRPVAERLRRRGRARQGAGGMDDRRRDRGRRRAVPAVALRARLPRHRYAEATAREVYKYYYRLRYPLDTSQAGRGRRLSPLHGRLEELGAVFGTKNGWERADYFEPGRPWRRAGEDQRAFGFSAPPYLDRLAEEHRAIRERVGIFDLTSFGKIDGLRAGCARAARAGVRRPHRSPGGARGLHAVPRSRRRHRRRPHRHAAGRGSLPRGHRRGGGRLRPRLAARSTRATMWRSAT